MTPQYWPNSETDEARPTSTIAADISNMAIHWDAKAAGVRQGREGQHREGAQKEGLEYDNDGLDLDMMIL